MDSAGTSVALQGTAAAALVARWILPGLGWSWLGAAAAGSAGEGRIRQALRIVIPGWVLSLLVVCLLGLAGCYRAGLEWAALACVSALGLVVGRRFRGRLAWPDPRVVLGAGAGLVAIVWIAFAIPERGAWLFGGWDPGVYVNQGIALSRTGTYRPPLPPPLGSLQPDELALFTRSFGSGYHELFIAVPVDLAAGTLSPYFFPLTPAFVAQLHRCGGLEAAMRVAQVAGLLSLLTLAAAFMSGLRPRAWAVFAVALVAAQPVFLYHLHVPVSEVTELALVGAVGWVWAAHRASPARGVLLGLVLAAGVLNRVSFVATGAAMLAALALSQPGQLSRGAAVEHLLAAAALLLALFLDLWVSAMVPRLGHVLPALWACAGAGLALVVGVDIVRLGPRCASPAGARWRWAWLGAAVLLGGALLLWLSRVPVRVRVAEGEWNLRALAAYWGPLWCLAASAGCCGVLFLRRRLAVARETWAWLVPLALTGVGLLTWKWIADLYPWATRRFLVPLVPLAAVAAAALPAALWGSGSGRTRWAARLAALGLAGAVAISSARPACQAWTSVEGGQVAVPLAEVARRLGPRDVVVTDQSWWGTPLLLTFGRPVLDASWLRREPEAADVGRGAGALRRLARAGWTVRVLTGDGSPAECCPAWGGSYRLDWESSELTWREVQHHARMRGFETRERSVRWRLHTWVPEGADDAD